MKRKHDKKLFTSLLCLLLCLSLTVPAFATGYTVKTGDSLWKIAQQQLGSGTRWGEIYEANKSRITNPRLIYAGQELEIPDGTSASQETAPQPAPAQPVEQTPVPAADATTDYSEKTNWARLPEATKQVDTFFIYPTVYQNYTEDAPSFAPIGDAGMRAGVEFVYETQASVFAQSTNVFMPYYRQGNLATIGDLRGEELISFLKNTAYEDVCAALDYYFENLNNGRPFILAGHSQGSIMSKMVLRDYMKRHPEYYERMIAAYALGFAITESDFAINPALKFAEGEDDTGVIVSWNIEGPGNAGKDNIVVMDGAISINPINWKRDATYAAASENAGSRTQFGAGTEITVSRPGVADAQVDPERGVVICTSDLPFISETNPAGAVIFGPESYHNGDYTFYYYSIQENVAKRIAAWFLTKEEHTIAPLAGTATDYSDAGNWIAQPEVTKAVDTFYIYPTSYLPAEADAPVYCEVDNDGMRTLALNNFNTNKGAYENSTNVFAPYYRQTSVAALENSGGEEAARVLSDVPRTDLYAALDYYFENLNGGRPFLLAAHSQGSMLTRIILKEYMAAHPEYYARMVAAYAIGYSITQDDLDRHPWLRFAERADDTGVIVSWNTEGPGNGESRLVLDGAISINPINWRRDETPAAAEENLGSLVDGKIVTPGVADAQVDTERGVVVSTANYPYIDTSKIASTQVFGEKSFHGYDYTFYYANIQKNVADRIAAYLAKDG